MTKEQAYDLGRKACHADRTKIEEDVPGDRRADWDNGWHDAFHELDDEGVQWWERSLHNPEKE